MNIFEAVFSWLFGDGHPHPTFVAEQWAAMAEYIKAQGGVVLAAELRAFQVDPALDPAAPDALDEEAFMLPILSHFDGVGVPSVDGAFIMYHFPNLASRAYVGNLSTAQLEARDPLETFNTRNKRPYVLEKFWQFSLADGPTMRNVMWLGALNLFLLLLFPIVCHWVGVGAATRTPVATGTVVAAGAIGAAPTFPVIVGGGSGPVRVPGAAPNSQLAPIAASAGVTQAPALSLQTNPAQRPVPGQPVMVPSSTLPGKVIPTFPVVVDGPGPTNFARRLVYRRPRPKRTDKELVGELAIGFLGWVKQIYWILLIYGILFFAVPWGRKKLLDSWNAQVRYASHSACCLIFFIPLLQ
jgi:hypothetical protein